MHMPSIVRLIQTSVATFFLAAAVGCSADVVSNDQEPVSESAEALTKDSPSIPTALAVPAGNRLAFRWHAEGVQIYVCTAGASGASWVFKAPDANLYREGRLVGAHYAGPTWEALDGSTVVGAKLAAATVDPTAVPWLLLKAASHTGTGRMSAVTYVQRLETTGGLAPAAGCDGTAIGAVANVPYTASYYFYRAAQCAEHR